MMRHQQNLLVLTSCEFMNLYLGLLVISVLLVTFTRRRNNSSTRNNVASRKKAYRGRYVMGGVGTSAPCSVTEKKQPYTFHSCRVGVSLRSLVTEHLSKKQDDSRAFIKPSFNRNLPCALHCPRKFRRARGVQVLLTQLLPAVHTAGIPSPFLLTALPCSSISLFTATAAARATLWAVAGRGGPFSHLLCLQCRASRTNCCLHQ